MIYAANMSEEDFQNGIDGNEAVALVAERAKKENAQVLPICAKIEEEITELPEDGKLMFLSELGLEQSGLDRLISTCYTLLDLISYITSGEMETKAWTIQKGTKAPQAAGKIHSDFERGFIRAEVIGYDDLMACGTMAAAREKGMIRSEGKDYVMQDGEKMPAEGQLIYRGYDVKDLIEGFIGEGRFGYEETAFLLLNQ